MRMAEIDFATIPTSVFQYNTANSVKVSREDSKFDVLGIEIFSVNL